MDDNIVVVDDSIMGVDASGVRVTVIVCRSFDNVVDDVAFVAVAVVAAVAVVVPSTILVVDDNV